jgi:hypothetical protein
MKLGPVVLKKSVFELFSLIISLIVRATRVCKEISNISKTPKTTEY